jgi:hypothetical protein
LLTANRQGNKGGECLTTFLPVSRYGVASRKQEHESTKGMRAGQEWETHPDLISQGPDDLRHSLSVSVRGRSREAVWLLTAEGLLEQSLPGRLR